jgi:hypothetical protein
LHVLWNLKRTIKQGWRWRRRRRNVGLLLLLDLPSLCSFFPLLQIQKYPLLLFAFFQKYSQLPISLLVELRM